MPTRPAAASDDTLLGHEDAAGGGFKAKVAGRWRSYAPACDKLLQETYLAGCPSMRLSVKGQIYKFDFEKMQHRNLNTLEECEMRAPPGLERPARKSLFSKDSLLNPFTPQARRSLKAVVCPQRPVFVVRVPEGGPGSVIRVPHPKKLGKAMTVAVPAEAKVGQPLFVDVPRTAMTHATYAAGGVAVGASGACAAVLATETGGSLAAGGAAAASSLVAAGAPALAGAAVLAGTVAAAGAAVHYASHSPGKAAAIGALTIGGLALADHVGEVGVAAAAGDLAAGAGELVDTVAGGVAGATSSPAPAAAAAAAEEAEAAGEAAGVGEELAEAGDPAEHAASAGEELLEDVDWLGGEAGEALDFAVDILADLF